MGFFGIWVAIRVLLRVGRAFKVVWLLLVDRQLVGSMPWQAIRHRVRHNRWLLLKVIALVLVAGVLPLSAVLPGLDEFTGLTVWIWAAALFLPWLASRRDQAA